MFYIVGLGNPGEKYEGTRHNVGRIILQNFVSAAGFAHWSKSKGANALYAHGKIGKEEVEFLLPETFMNNSGQSVLYLQRKRNVEPSHIIVLYDDVDLPLGKIKVSAGRGAGGHNGIASIIKALGTKDFIRIRIGISGTSFWTGKTKRPTGERLSKYVLGRFSKHDREKIGAVEKEVYEVLRLIIEDGVEKAMNACNSA